METQYVYCLFSIANEYDQPKNNLLAVWFVKPSHDELKKLLTSISNRVSDTDVNNIRKKGYEIKISEYHIRLEKTEVGVKFNL